ncbi:MAG: erythromycin esterase family protein [Gemmatimonadota bacterium]
MPATRARPCRALGAVAAACLGTAFLLGSVAEVRGQHPLNLGFERDGVGGPGQPWGWRPMPFGGPGTTATLDSSVTKEGERSFRISRPAPAADHALMYWIPPLAACGREATLTGWIRTEHVDGRAIVTVQSWAAGAFRTDTARVSGPGDGAGWVPLEASVTVDSAAHSIVVTVGLSGTGTAWFDGLVVAVDGIPLREPPVAEGPSKEERAWLDARTHVVDGVDAPAFLDRSDDEDLEPFGRIVGDARVVALGEATHGTSEFFRAKHRLTRYLVERLGFRVFLIEANQLPVERINEYVAGGPGEAADVMRTMFAVWNTVEVRDLIEWMRAHNARHPERRVAFVGFDMQDPSAPIDSLDATLGTLAPELAGRVRALHADFREAWRQGPYPQATEERRREWMEDGEEAWRLVSEVRPRLLDAAREAGDSTAVEWAVQNANVVRQAARTAFTQDIPTRDSAMASNILWTLERRFPGARAVVWAHDAHISRGEDAVYDYYGGGSMGGVLSRALGDDYRAIGLLTYGGAYTGYLGGRTLQVPLFPAPVGSVEEALHRIAAERTAPILLADLREASAEPEGAWLLEPRPIRLLGYAAEDWGFAYPIAVARQFDAVLFVDESTASRLLR